jgi:hypothetical protein
MFKILFLTFMVKFTSLAAFPISPNYLSFSLSKLVECLYRNSDDDEVLLSKDELQNNEHIIDSSQEKVLFEATSPYEQAGFISRILFLWVNPLIRVSPCSQ